MTVTVTRPPAVLGPGCQDCGSPPTVNRYAVPARRTDEGKLVLARSGAAWYCGVCAIAAAKEGR